MMGLRLRDLGRRVVGLTLAKLAGAVVLFAADDAPNPKGGGDLFTMMLPFLAIFALFYFLMIRPQRREQARQQEMLNAVKKNDRVITIGGIYGVVANVNQDTKEATIKVDETTNTKLRITLSSIARVLGEESSEESAKK
jgi:preprotein translocase subunit YajC